jgi:hypothetical protein
MFLSSLLTCGICWACRICFCPPCWHDICCVCRMFLSALLTCDICWVCWLCFKTYSTHSAYVTCQQGGQKHILHTQHKSHVNKEDKNIFYTLSICHMSTRRTKTYSTHSAYVTCQQGWICLCPPCWHVTYAECVDYVFVLLVDMWHMLSV